MNEVIVPHPSGTGQLHMSIPAAEQLVQQLAGAIQLAEENHANLRNVRLTEDGFIDRESFFEFFRQTDMTASQFRNNIGKLYAALLGWTSPQDGGGAGQQVHCGKCRQALSEPCVYRGSGHRRFEPSWPYLLCANTLKQYADEILECLKPTLSENFRLLLNHL